MEEYIKKSELLKANKDAWSGVVNIDESGSYIAMENEGIFDDLPTYSIPETAISGEYIRKADMERILYSTNNPIRIGEEFLDLPTYTMPDIEEIKAEIEEFREETFHRPNTDYEAYASIEHCLEIIDKHIGGDK